MAPQKNIFEKNMILSQIMPNIMPDPRLTMAFSKIDRSNFVPEHMRGMCRIDEHLAITPDKYITAPTILAKMIQAAHLKPYDQVLLIGAGTGYSTSVIARLAHKVIAIEKDPSIARKANNLLHQLDQKNVIYITTDYSYGYPEASKYDVIFIEGSVSFIPDTILTQLNEGGRLVTVLTNPSSPKNAKFQLGELCVISKNHGIYNKTALYPVSIYPLSEFNKIDDCQIYEGL